MNDHYKQFLNRLVQYRVQHKLTQERVSQELGITQSQLSKQELGKTIVACRSLARLMEMGWDVDCLFTGKSFRQEPSELSALLAKTEASCHGSLLEFAAWALEKGLEKPGREDTCGLFLLKRASSQTDGSLILGLREFTGKTQVSMAEALGVNIKKYRSLERNQIQPDAELLLGLYDETGCLPSLFFAGENLEYRIIDGLWGCLRPEKQRELLSALSQAGRFLRA